MPGVLTLALLVERMTRRRRLFGLPAPRIAVGEPADLCLVDLDANGWSARTATRAARSNCCFAGRELRGRVLLTVAAGAVAYRERAFAGGRAHDARRLRAARGRHALRRRACGAAAPGRGGEVVFTTGMARLPGVVTDPSYAGS